MSGVNGYHELFELMVDKGASDLHLWVPSPPVLRIDGVLTPLSEFAPATPEYVETVFDEITTAEQKNTFLEELELDFAYSIPGLARLRVNALKQRGRLALPSAWYHTKSHPLMNWGYQKSAKGLFSNQGDSSWSPDLPAAASLLPWLL